MQNESSFNTDGRFPAHNLTAANGGIGSKAWLAPQPGGSVFWSLGYYPAGVKGVGPPGAMFVLSTEQFWGGESLYLVIALGIPWKKGGLILLLFPSYIGTWYMLNQLTLDRGPASPYPNDKCKISNNNCWAAGNAGEMDFLEPGWNLPDISDDPRYRKSFSTQVRFVTSNGVLIMADVPCGGCWDDPINLSSSIRLADASMVVSTAVASRRTTFFLPASHVQWNQLST